MARSVRFDCQRLEVFGQAVEAVAVIDELVEELPEGRAYIRDRGIGTAAPGPHPTAGRDGQGHGRGHGQGRSPGARPLRGLRAATGS
jgi:hypothetical protein